MFCLLTAVNLLLLHSVYLLACHIPMKPRRMVVVMMVANIH